jgi:hypothetical protein
MAIWQLDTEKQAYRVGYGYSYTWTNSYIVDARDEADATLMVRELAHQEAMVMPNGSAVVWAKVRPGIDGPAPADVIDVGEEGHRGSYHFNMQLLNTARMVGYSGARLVWYKRWRGPLLEEDFTGEVLTDDFRTLLQSSLLTWLIEELHVRTRSGLPITSYYVDPLVWGWQMRDGRNRRRKSVLGPP